MKDKKFHIILLIFFIVIVIGLFAIFKVLYERKSEVQLIPTTEYSKSQVIDLICSTTKRPNYEVEYVDPLSGMRVNCKSFNNKRRWELESNIGRQIYYDDVNKNESYMISEKYKGILISDEIKEEYCEIYIDVIEQPSCIIEKEEEK